MMGLTNRSLQGWCLFLAVFEVPNIWNVLKGAKLAGFQARLGGTVTARRLWAVFLALLCCARIAVVRAPTSKNVLLHNAAVHIIEALFLVPESGLMGNFGEKPVAAVIIANAVLFSGIALRR